MKVHFRILSFIILLLCFLFGLFHEENILIEQDEAETEVLSDIPFAREFIQWADTVGWRWEWLAAMAYQESKFNPQARSHVGAQGLMQLMPSTAAKYGLNDSTIFNPADNVRAAALYLLSLRQTFSFISNEDEQRRFVLAAYNGGVAHVMDARRLAKRYGRSAYSWYGNTEYGLQRLAEPQIAADSVVLYGCFNATETTSYVRKVERSYHKIAQQ